MDEESTSYFRQIVRDAISDLTKQGCSYCFSEEQYKAINEKVPCTITRCLDGVYYIRKNTFEKCRKSNKGSSLRSDSNDNKDNIQG